MTTQRKGPSLLGLPDRFVSAEIEAEAPPAFDAAQYSFFGDLSAAETGLEGALEDGLEAPPAEEGLSSQDYGLHNAEDEGLALEEEDLSVASIFRNQLGLGAPLKTPTRLVDPDDDAGLDALLTDPLAVARKQLRDDDYDQRELPSELFPDTMSVSSAAAVAQSPSLFGAASSSYTLFDGYTSVLGASCGPDGMPGATSGSSSFTPAPQPPLQHPSPPSSSVGSSLLQMLKRPSQPLLKAMTVEELEARMFGTADATASASAAPGGVLPSPGALLADVSGAVRVSGSGGVGHDTMAAAGPFQQQQHPQALTTRPLPGVPVSNAATWQGPAVQGPRMSVHMAGGPIVSPSAFPDQLQLPQSPPGSQGQAPQPSQGTSQPLPPQHHPLHGAAAHHGPMQMPPQPLPGAAGVGLFPQPHVMGGSHMGSGPQPPNFMYNNSNGMLAPQPPQHHHHQPHHQHPPSPGMLPPGAMAPSQYGLGAPYGPQRGPMPLYGPGLMGMSGPPPYMHDGGFPIRPMGGPLGMPGPMHGVPARQGPFGYGPGPALGPGAAPGQQQRQQQQPPHQFPAPGPQRSPVLTGPQPPPGSGAQRTMPGLLGPGAPGAPRPNQTRQVVPAASDFGQQFAARANGVQVAPGAGPLVAAAATAAGRAGGTSSGLSSRLGGKWMRPEDVEYIVRSMLYTVANGVPYVEDYYYQAFVHKHVSQPSRQQLSHGAFPMAAPFVPEALRELSEDQMSLMRLDSSVRAKFVEGVQGLGKIVLSNIRTPKVLMDLTDREFKGSDARSRGAALAEGEGSGNVAKGSSEQQGRCARPLEQEPLLAARIMIEDCINLLLDVDDIDRLANHMAALGHAQQRAVAAALSLPGGPTAAVAATAAAAGTLAAAGLYAPSAPGPLQPMQLRQRRELLLAGINGAFRLPNSPQGVAAGSGLGTEGFMDLDSGTLVGGSSLGDGVLIRILALSKGRSVVARALLAIAPPASLVAPKPAVATAAEGSGRPVIAAAGGEQQPQGNDAVAAELGPHQQVDAEAAEAGGSLLDTGVPGPYVLLWATLRNAWMIFGTSLQQSLEAVMERALLESTARLAVALQEALLRLATQRDVVEAAAAFNAGCQQHVEALCQGNSVMAGSMEVTLLPLAQTRAAEPPPSLSSSSSVAAGLSTAAQAWLGDALAALVMRALQLGLVEGESQPPGDSGAARCSCTGSGADFSSAAAAGPQRKSSSGGGGTDSGGSRALVEEWRREYGLLHERLSRHLATLAGIHEMAAASGNAEALAVVRALSCPPLVNAMLQHASPEQANELRAASPLLGA